MNLHWHHYHSETHFTLGITLGILHFKSFDRCLLMLIHWYSSIKNSLWDLDREEGGAPKKWCLQTMGLEKTPESPLDSKEIKPVNLKGNQPWIFVGRTDAEVETLVLWSSEANSWLIGKVPDAGKDWGQKEKRASEDEMAGWHHRYDGHELGQTSGGGEGQRGLACCSPWGHKESDTTWWLNNNNRIVSWP